MRTNLVIVCVLLVLTIAGGVAASNTAYGLSQRYISAAEELQALIETANWPRAAATADAYLDSWTATVPWLQTLINHEDADDLTLALLQLKAGILAEDEVTCYEACALLREHARHLYHRDALTWGNIL